MAEYIGIQMLVFIVCVESGFMYVVYCYIRKM